MSAVCAMALGVSAHIAPRSSKPAALSPLRFQTRVGNPACRILAAMGCPIRPKPAMPTVERDSIRLTSSAGQSLSDTPAIAELVEDDCNDQDDADGHGLEVRLHADEVHAIGEDRNEKCAKDRADDPPFSTAQ